MLTENIQRHAGLECPGRPLMNSIKNGDTGYRGPCRYRRERCSRLEPLMIISRVRAASNQVGGRGEAGNRIPHKKGIKAMPSKEKLQGLYT